METLLTFAVCIAVVAWTVSNLLMEDGGILYPYFRLLDRLAYNGKAWMARPLGMCAKCFAGQIALWSGFVFIADQYAVVPVLAFGKHVFLICLAVFLTYQLDHFKTNA